MRVVLALVGCGTVGGAFCEFLGREKNELQKKTGVTIEIRYIVSKTFKTAKKLKLDPALFESDYSKVLLDPEVDVVIELVGGIATAKEIITKALVAKKHVITANKALLAFHCTELLSVARKNGVTLAFEASCAGGIPIIKTFYDGLLGNHFDAIYGIVNGTCNYILTEMTTTKQSYDEALKKAQAEGFAEADPSLDVSGMDSAHKLAILSSLAFACQVDFRTIDVEGIDGLDLVDIEYGQELGYIIKLLAIAQKRSNGISLRVRPAFIAHEHPLSWISGPFNAISVYSRPVGHTMYYGRGAGGFPTASAVLSDVLAIAIGSYSQLFNSIAIWPDQTPPATQLNVEDLHGRYYIRLMVKDQPGVFASFASILGNKEISISSVLQKEPAAVNKNEPPVVPVVITTHTCREGNLRRALGEIADMPASIQEPIGINIIDEHEEWI